MDIDNINRKLSIIIPVYNSEGMLGKCIDSVLAQQYVDFDLILVDDASTDSSGQICDEYAQKYERIRVIHHDKNQGLSVSREDGLRATESEWVGFVDNDDIIAPDMYKHCFELADKYGAELVCIRGENKTSEEIQSHIWEKGSEQPVVLSGHEAVTEIYANRLDFPLVLPVWGKLIKRSLVERALVETQLYKKRLYWVYFEDVLFTPMLIWLTDKAVFENRLMYLHRRARTSLAASLQPREFHYQAAEAGFEVLRFLEGHELKEAFEGHITGCFMNMQSVWYKVWKYENDSRKKDKFNQFVDKAFDEYGAKLKKVKYCGISAKVNRLNIQIFKINRNLWGMTIGNLYFNLLNRRTY